MSKKLVLVWVLLNICVSMEYAFAKEVKKQKSSAGAHSQLGTSFRFDGASLQGRYQNSASTTATVEDDKFIDDLLGERKNFNDRILKDQDRN